MTPPQSSVDFVPTQLEQRGHSRHCYDPAWILSPLRSNSGDVLATVTIQRGFYPHSARTAGTFSPLPQSSVDFIPTPLGPHSPTLRATSGERIAEPCTRRCLDGGFCGKCVEKITEGLSLKVQHARISTAELASKNRQTRCRLAHGSDEISATALLSGRDRFRRSVCPTRNTRGGFHFDKHDQP